MKLNLGAKPAHKSEDLVFGWLSGERYFVRFWLAVLLALGFFGAAWVGLQIEVPRSLMTDSPRVEKAQLLMLDSENYASLQELIHTERLPSLGIKESVGEAPLVANLLQQLGLQETERERVRLYPAPELVSELRWPEGESKGFALPDLPALNESEWPRWGEKDLKWSLEIEGGAEFANRLASKSFLWDFPLPPEKEILWALVFDDLGELVFSDAVDEKDAPWQGELRRFFAKALREHERVPEPFAGVVSLKFKQVER